MLFEKKPFSAHKLPEVFDSYKPKVSFCIDSDSYTVKIAETKQELFNAFQLRNRVFYEERTGRSAEQGLDIDDMDSVADHLIIIKKDTQKIVGTYRLVSSRFHKSFYSQKFFKIDHVLDERKDHKVEVGRACTDMSFRSSKAIHYIWLGLARYFKETLSRYMFGCVGIVKLQKVDLIGMYNYLLKNNYVDPALYVVPQEPYKLSSMDTIDNEYIYNKLPRLFVWYLSLGAKVGGPPGYDHELRSYDFFIILDFKYIEKTQLINNYEDAVYLKNYLNSRPPRV